MPFPDYRQLDQMDCGPTCLRMISKFYGRGIRLQYLRQLCASSRDGVSMLGISQAAEKIGFRSLGAILSLEELNQAELPCILYWRQNHFVVLYKIRGGRYHIADPARGLLVLSEEELSRNWLGIGRNQPGVVLLLNPSPVFYDQEDEKKNALKWSFLIRYLLQYRKLLVQLLLGLGAGSLLQLLTPFLTQSIVDVGINAKNLEFIYLILFAQGALIIGRQSIDFIRSWILLHISTRINLSILTDFLIKLMQLPMAFFDTRMTGDIMQRLNDQRRIESFLTGSALNMIFSILNLIVFSFILAYYNIAVFLTFAGSSLLYMLWITGFLKQRRMLDYKNFDLASKNQSNVVQLVNGMQEIKLNNCEQQKRWEWEHLQARLFKYRIKELALSQYQQGGATLINECTNLFISFLSAKSVIQGHLTLGGMLAIQYIIGQLNNPVQQFLNFVQGYQDARLSLERLNEIHQMEGEEPPEKDFQTDLPENKSLSINNLTFRYPGAGNETVLKGIDILIPQGKVTAIVGMSGSGKTTILKLLLRFYQPELGRIYAGEEPIDNISFKTWRAKCGTVMQDGFIFSDTIAKNIAVGDEDPDNGKLRISIKTANLQDFIDSLPLGVNTKIGSEGNGISQGQKQRILIARAIYKDPEYLFFDEATNALDANNETVIMDNLQRFFKGRTVVIVAHRLSTVNSADNIIVLDKGKITEQGTHATLTALKGRYYQLVKNQLELGN
jgi:ATP-binding cassette subfamily B protein